MPNKKLKQDDLEEKTQSELDEEKAILKVLTETDTDLTVKVYRVDDQGVNGKIWLGDIPNDAFSLQYIKNKWGGGIYLINVLNSLGHYAIRKKLQIGGLPIEETEEIVISNIGNNNSDIIKMMQLQMEGERQRGDRLMEAVIAGLSNKNDAPAPSNSMAEMLTMFTAFQGLMPKPVTVESPTDKLKEVMDLASMINKASGGGGETNEYDILGKAFETFAPVFKDAVLKEQPKLNNANQEGETMTVEQLKSALKYLVQIKQTGATPEDAANLIKEKMPAPFLMLITGLLKRENWFNILVNHLPDIANIKEWIEELRIELLGLTPIKVSATVTGSGPDIAGIDNGSSYSIPLSTTGDT